MKETHAFFRPQEDAKANVSAAYLLQVINPMKVLFDCCLPFLLAHGGLQVQIEQTAAALREAGIDVEMLRWWDDKQKGDVIHFFGRAGTSYIELARAKGMRVVQAELLTGTGSRPLGRLKLQSAVIAISRRILPKMFAARMAWDSYRLADACVALTSWEAKLMHMLFGAPLDRLHVVPNGVENVFLESVPPNTRGPWLVCTATLTERKRVLELAKAAIAAKTPTWVIGKPYSPGDSYAQEFIRLAQANPQFLRYEGPIMDRAQMARIYREARGFVLLSTMESLSLSALEAAACGCPLLLSDLPWATETFGGEARYCPIANEELTAPILRSFYDAAPTLAAPARPKSWREIGVQLAEIYRRVCNTSR